MYLNGDGIAGKDARGGTDHRRPLPALLQRRRRRREVTLPPEEYAAAWDVVIDTGGDADADPTYAAGATFDLSTPQPRRAPRARRARRPARPLGRRLPRALRTGTRDHVTDHRRERRAAVRPISTYRLQISRDFDLLDAARRAALPARPRRRLGLPLAAAGRGARQRPRLRRRRPRPVDPRAAAPRGSRRSPPRPGGWAWACWSTSCPTTSASRRRRRTRGGGTCSRTAASPSTPRRSTSTGPPAAAGCVIPVLGDDDERRARSRSCASRRRAPLPRPPLPARARHDDDADRREQHYELVNWRAADADLNYRRFFAVNTLAAIRVEDPEVFAESHAEIRRWFDEGLVDGLRVDHPDGLRDPGGYLDDLAALTGGAYVLVEKILEPGEELPRRLGDRRHHRVRRARAHRPGARPTPPARRRSTRSRTGCAERRSTGTGWSTTPSARSPTASCTPRCCGSPARSAVLETVPEDAADRGRRRRRGRRAPRLLPGLPLLPARGPRAPRPGLRGRARAPRPTSRRRSTCSSRSCRDRVEPAGAALPADQRAW